MSEDSGWETVSEHTDEGDSERLESSTMDPGKDAPVAPTPASGNEGYVPEVDELTGFIKTMLDASPDAGLKTVANAIKAAHPTWAVGDKRLQKMLAEAKKPPPVEVLPLDLDADGRIAGIEGMDFSFRSFHGAFDLSDAEVLAKITADCKVAALSFSC